jgi:hypothetical protein
MLEDVGFEMGSKIEVCYQQNLIIIRKVNDYHEPNNVQKQPSYPLTDTVSAATTNEAESSQPRECAAFSRPAALQYAGANRSI